VNLRKNLSLKLLAIILAFVSWVWVESQGDLLKTIETTADLVGLPLDMEVVGAMPMVSLQLRGPEPTLRTLPPERVVVKVNAADQSLQPGVNLIPIDPAQVRVPAGVQVDRITPAVLEVHVERTFTREVPVEPAIQGLPAPGYEVTGTRVTPPRIFIEGPEPAVMEVETVTTQTISIDGKTESLRLEVLPLPAGPAGRQVRLAGPSLRVEVVVRIRPLGTERTLSGVPIVALGVTPGSPRPIFRPAQVEVRVSGPQVVVDDLSAGELEAVADLTSLPPSATDLRSADLLVRPVSGAGRALANLDFEVLHDDPIQITWEDVAE
jgi:YbbR domain-containing protein